MSISSGSNRRRKNRHMLKRANSGYNISDAEDSYKTDEFASEGNIITINEGDQIVVICKIDNPIQAFYYKIDDGAWNEVRCDGTRKIENFVFVF